MASLSQFLFHAGSCLPAAGPIPRESRHPIARAGPKPPASTMSNFAMAPRGDAAMNVSLTPELEAMIRQQVDSGRYNNASEVVREALRLLDEHQRLQHLRSLLAVGLEQAQRGELVEFTPELFEDIDRRVEERFLRGEEPDPDVCP